MAQRKLQQLNAAQQLGGLAVFPGNRLEALEADRQGQHSIRVNDQYRVCFVWRDGDAYDVEIVQAYLRHPAHEELGVRFNRSLSSAWIDDFAVGGLEQLEGLV